MKILSLLRSKSSQKYIRLLEKLVSYGAVGFSGTVIHYMIMYGLINYGIAPSLATTLGAIAGAIVNFAGCRFYVFNEPNKKYLGEIVRFFIVASILIVANTTFLMLASSMINLWVAQVAATISCFILGFVLNRFWTFKASD